MEFNNFHGSTSKFWQPWNSDVKSVNPAETIAVSDLFRVLGGGR